MREFLAAPWKFALKCMSNRRDHLVSYAFSFFLKDLHI